ncbi:MAG: hypothetical protein HY934_08350, partial [Candidatus Firestonebacteria bacterium]|nr:hypothetical protein [Candidatus Firestonebacteria bacterium]
MKVLTGKKLLLLITMLLSIGILLIGCGDNRPDAVQKTFIPVDNPPLSPFSPHPPGDVRATYEKKDQAPFDTTGIKVSWDRSAALVSADNIVLYRIFRGNDSKDLG